MQVAFVWMVGLSHMQHTTVQKGRIHKKLVVSTDAGQERAASKRRVNDHLAVIVADAERRLERGHTDTRVEHARQRDELQELTSCMELVHEWAAGRPQGRQACAETLGNCTQMELASTWLGGAMLEWDPSQGHRRR